MGNINEMTRQTNIKMGDRKTISNMKVYDIQRRDLFSIGPHMLGLIFIGVGIFTIVSPLFMTGNTSVWKAIIAGIVALLLGLMVVTSYGGTFFDFKRKRYKNYYSLSGIRIGNWQNLPDLKLIRVFPLTSRVSRTFDGVHQSTSGNVTLYKIALFGDKSKPILVFENNHLDRTLKEAKILAENLKVVLDIQLTEMNGGFELKK